MKQENSAIKKRIFTAAIAAVTLFSVVGGISAGAFDEWSYSEDLTVYVNGQKIDNDKYKPIIVNDRTLVRLVPVFEALGYEHSEMDENKFIRFVQITTNATYTFKAESTKAVAGSGSILEDGFPEGDEYLLEVPATLQYYDVFYVPIRSFCEMTDLDIEWDDATRSVYIGSKPGDTDNGLITYDEAKALAEQYVNDSDIALSGNTAPVEYNGRDAYEFRMYSKSMAASGGSGSLGMVVYVYIDNGEIVNVSGNGEQESNSASGSGTESLAAGRYMGGETGSHIGNSYCCGGYDVGSGKDIVRQYMNNEITLEEVAEFSRTRHNTNRTVSGFTIQQALNVIKAAYGIEITGTADIYENCVTTRMDGMSYGVSYDPETERYYAAASTAKDIIKDGNDTNSTVTILNISGEIVGGAN